jgi:hypothetical protein
LPGVFIKPKSSEKDGFTQRLLYYHDKSTTKKPAVIFYTKALNKEDKQL